MSPTGRIKGSMLLKVSHDVEATRKKARQMHGPGGVDFSWKGMKDKKSPVVLLHISRRLIKMVSILFFSPACKAMDLQHLEQLRR
jgi:hypothetical protein